MTRREKIEDEAYMILQEIAFLFSINEDKCEVVAVNLKNPNQKAVFYQRDKDLLFIESNMSKENTYRTMLIAERNKEELIEGMNKWESTLQTK
jgi:ABC-type lipoprotein release transport system permease subunit